MDDKPEIKCEKCGWRGYHDQLRHDEDGTGVACHCPNCGLWEYVIVIRNEEDAIEYPCEKCGCDTEHNGRHAFWSSELGVCDGCAEEYGCECNCFPPPSLSRRYHYDELERVEQVRFVFSTVTIPEHAEIVWDEDGGRYDPPEAIGAIIVPKKSYTTMHLEEREIWRVREDIED